MVFLTARDGSTWTLPYHRSEWTRHDWLAFIAISCRSPQRIESTLPLSSIGLLYWFRGLRFDRSY